MQVEDYMNETPLRLLEMLTQTREDLWRAAQALTERGVTRIIPVSYTHLALPTK